MDGVRTQLNGFERFMEEWGGVIQMALGTVLLLAGGFILTWENILAMPLLAALVTSVFSLFIINGAAMTRASLAEKMQDEDTESLANSQQPRYQQQLPDRDVLWKRSALIGGVFLVSAVLIIGITWAMVAGIALLISSEMDAAGTEALIWELVYFALALIPIIVALYALLQAFVLSVALVDFRLYPQEIIQHYHYEEGNPLEKEALISGIWSALKAGLIMGVGSAVILVIQVGLEWLDAVDASLWIVGGVVLLMLAGAWWIISWQSQRETEQHVEEWLDKSEAYLIEEYGEDSDEVRQFRVERDEYNRMTPEERQLLADEAEPLPDELLSNQPYSVMGDIAGNLWKYLIGFLVLGGVLAVAAVWVAASLGVSREIAELIGGITLLVSFIGSFFILFKFFLQDLLQMPEILTDIEEAAQSGDLVTLRQLLPEAEKQLSMVEFGGVIANLYMSVGEVDKGEELARESIAMQMKNQKDDDDNDMQKAFLPESLQALGNILMERGYYDKSRVPLRQALSYNPEHIGAKVSLIEAHLYLKEPQRALEIVESLPDNPEKIKEAGHPLAQIHLLKAWAFAQMNRRKEAVELMKRGMSEYDGDGRMTKVALHYYAGLILQVLGRHTRAQAAFQAVIDELPGSILAINAKKHLDGQTTVPL